MDAVGRDDITEGKVIVTEKLGEVVKQHQQHSKGTLQEGEGVRERRERYSVKQLKMCLIKI